MGRIDSLSGVKRPGFVDTESHRDSDTNFDITHFFYYIGWYYIVEKMGCIKFVKYLKIRWFCVEKVKIEALKGKTFNFNENNENHKVYPSPCAETVMVYIPKNKKNENSFTTGYTSYKHPHHMSSFKSPRNLISTINFWSPSVLVHVK